MANVFFLLQGTDVRCVSLTLPGMPLFAFLTVSTVETKNAEFGVRHPPVNIQELTGMSPSSGAMVATKFDDGSTFRRVGRLPMQSE